MNRRFPILPEDLFIYAVIILSALGIALIETPPEPRHVAQTKSAAP